MEGVFQLVIGQSCFRHLYCYYFNPLPVIILFFLPLMMYSNSNEGELVVLEKNSCSAKADDLIFPSSRCRRVFC